MGPDRDTSDDDVAEAAVEEQLEPDLPEPRRRHWGSRVGGRTEQLPEITGKFYIGQGPHFRTTR